MKTLLLAASLALLLVGTGNATAGVVIQDFFGSTDDLGNGTLTRHDAAGNTVIMGSGQQGPTLVGLDGLRAQFPDNGTAVWRAPGGQHAATWFFAAASTDPFETVTPGDVNNLVVVAGADAGTGGHLAALLPFTPPAGAFKVSADMIPEGGDLRDWVAIGFTSSLATLNNNFEGSGQAWLLLKMNATGLGATTWELHTNGMAGPSLTGNTTLTGNYIPLELTYDPVAHLVSGSISGVSTPTISYSATGISGVGMEAVEHVSFGVADDFAVQSAFTTEWTGATSANWIASGNWSGALPGATAGTTNIDTAIFNQNAPNSPLAIDAGRNVQNITFDTSSVNSVTVGTVGGQALLLSRGGTIQTTSTVINPQTVNAPLLLEGDYIFTSGAGSSSATLSFGGGIAPAVTSGITTLTLDGSNTGANTIRGVLADNGAGRLAVTKSGSGVWVFSGANTYSGDTTVSAGTLKFNINSGAVTIAAGVTATVASGATLELAGSISALGTAGGNRVHIVNNSTASGVVVSGVNQIVGAIDGSGATQINAASELTANHIIQSALIIGGAVGSPGLVTIDASDASGNPLAQPSGFALAGLLTPSGPFGADGISFTNLSSAAGGGADLATLSLGNPAVGGSLSPVPEPSTFALLVLGSVLVGFSVARSVWSVRRRHGSGSEICALNCGPRCARRSLVRLS